MSTDLISYRSRPLAVRDRRTAAEVRKARRPALLAAARIEAAAFTAHTAMHHAGMLSATEARLIQQAPLGEPRYKAIADAFAGYACHEIAMLGEGMGL
jgi:hypothetical protein